MTEELPWSEFFCLWKENGAHLILLIFLSAILKAQMFNLKNWQHQNLEKC